MNTHSTSVKGIPKYKTIANAGTIHKFTFNQLNNSLQKSSKSNRSNTYPWWARMAGASTSIQAPAAAASTGSAGFRSLPLSEQSRSAPLVLPRRSTLSAFGSFLQPLLGCMIDEEPARMILRYSRQASMVRDIDNGGREWENHGMRKRTSRKKPRHP